LTELAEVLKLSAGEVIATVGTAPLTVIDFVSVPYALSQETVIVFGPATIGTELVAGVLDALPLTVQLMAGVPDTE
jgi:hypothetical protein